MVRAFLICLFVFSLYACGGSGNGGINDDFPGGASGLRTPSGLSTRVVSSSQIDLNWNPTADAIGYMIYGNGTTATTISTSYSITGLSPATQYCFSIAAFGGSGNVSAQSSAVCATTEYTAPSEWTTVRSGTANKLSNVVWTGNKLVVVEETFGSSTKVHTSPDGRAWSSFSTSGFAFNGARDVVYGNNQYVAINTWLFTSPDGIAWELADTSFSKARALAWSSPLSLYVAVGDAGIIRTSTDGKNWNTVDPAPTTANLYGVAWLNGRFFAVGDGGAILTSVDGLDWISATSPASSFPLESVAWNGQSGADALYVATGYSTAFVSSNGDTWTSAAAPPPGFNDSVAWGGGSANCFVAVGSDSHIFSSPDGQTWTPTVYAQLGLNEVVWTGSRFVAVGGRGTILVSEDAIDWTIVASGADLKGLAHDGTRFIAVGSNGRLAISDDSNLWEYRHTGNDSHYLNGIAWDGSRYIAVGQTYSLYSGDLSSWQVSWRGATATDTAIIWDGSQFVRTGYGIMTWDGITTYSGTSDPLWSWSYFTNSEWFNDLYWDGSTYVAVGNNGVIYTSPDATSESWTPRTSGTDKKLEAVTKGGGRFVAVGGGGTILVSDDGGVNWIAQSSGVSSAIYDVTWTGSRFVAVGYRGLILTSIDGSSWSVTEHGSTNLYSVLSSGTTTVIVGEKGTIIRNNQ